MFMANQLMDSPAFREKATSPDIWRGIKKDTDALILMLGLTGNHAIPYHSNAQHNIMRAFGQNDVSCNGEALDTLLQAASYLGVSESPRRQDVILPSTLVDYGEFLRKTGQGPMPDNFNSLVQLVDSNSNTRLKRRLLEQSLPDHFSQGTATDGMTRDVVKCPEQFAEAYKMALFETAMQVLFTEGTGADYSTMPTEVFSRTPMEVLGRIVLSDRSAVITERQAIARAYTLCEELLNSPDFELRGTQSSPNLPYEIGAIRLALENAQKLYGTHTNKTYLDYQNLRVPNPESRALSVNKR
jgi:hypothetical protein